MPELVIAVDLGFSSTKKSCGWAHKIMDQEVEPEAKNSTFGKLPEKIAGIIREKRVANVSLVLEAPLTYAFRKDGNPAGRIFNKEISEKSLQKEENKKGSYWFCQGGVLTAFAADRFLTLFSVELKKLKKRKPIKIYEGFVATKKIYGRKDKDLIKHQKDACHLVKAFCHTNEDTGSFRGQDCLYIRVQCNVEDAQRLVRITPRYGLKIQDDIILVKGS